MSFPENCYINVEWDPDLSFVKNRGKWKERETENRLKNAGVSVGSFARAFQEIVGRHENAELDQETIC